MIASRRLLSVKSRDVRLLSLIRFSMSASTFSSLAIDVSMISRLLSYSRSSKLSVEPVSFV